MALLGFQGFDWSNVPEHYAATPWVNNANTGAISYPTGRLGTGRAMHSNTQDEFRGHDFLLPANTQTLIVGCAFSNPTNWGGSPIIALRDGGTIQCDLRINGSKQLIATRNGTTLGTSTSALIDNIWEYLEIKATIDNSAGTFEIRRNGTVVLTLTGLDTQTSANAYATRVSFRNGIYDDIYVANTSGSMNNTYLGDVRAEAIFPTGAGNSTQFTPSAGSNWQNVDDNPGDDDTTYNSSATAGQIDTFTMANLTASGTIKGVNQYVRHRKDDAGTRTVRSVVRIGTTNYEGPDVGVTTSYVTTLELRETSPATTAAWTVSEVNGLEAGYKVQA